MGRLPRPIEDSLVDHALNRGNNRADVFADPDDHQAFLAALSRTRQCYPFRLFGYGLMTNHFRLLLRPESGQAISRVLQSLTVAHTWRYHRRPRLASGEKRGHSALSRVIRYVPFSPFRDHSHPSPQRSAISSRKTGRSSGHLGKRTLGFNLTAGAIHLSCGLISATYDRFLSDDLRAACLR